MKPPTNLTMIVYDRFFALIKAKRVTTTMLRKHKVVSEATLQKMRHGGTGLSYDSLNRICAYLECQPADIMEFIDDEEVGAWLAKIRENPNN